MFITLKSASQDLHILHISVATGSSHPDYPGHLGHFLSGSKSVSPRHTNVPDPDQKYLVIVRIKTNKNIYTLQ